MKRLLGEYIRFRKTGLFKRGNAMLLLILLPSLAVALIGLFNNSVYSTAYYFVVLSNIFFMSLVSLIVVNNLGEGRYLVYSTMPVRSQDLIAFIYIKTYLILSFGFVFSGIINVIHYGLSYIAVHFFCFGLSLCLSNLFIPLISSGEFTMPGENQVTAIITIIITIIFTGTIIISITLLSGRVGVNTYMSHPLFILAISLLSVVLTITAILTLKRSFANTITKVRLMV